MDVLKAGFRNIVLLSLFFLIIVGLCGTINAYPYIEPYARKRIPELEAERKRIQDRIEQGVSDEFSVEERRRMIEEIDARIEGFRRDDRIYSQNKRDTATANNNAKRVEEAREAREWVNNNEREWAELVEDFLSWSNEEQSNYRSGISDDQLAELNRRVGLRNELATQADNSQGSGPPEGGVNTDFITDSIDKLAELSSDLFNRIMEALNTGGTASEAAHAGEITGDDPYDFSDDGSPASGSGQTEGTDQTSGDAGCDGSGPDCDGGEAETQQTGGSAQTEGTDQTGGATQTEGSDQTGETTQTGDDGGEAETQQPDLSDSLISGDPEDERNRNVNPRTAPRNWQLQKELDREND